MQCIILHGSFGSKDGNWFPWLKKALENLGHEVFLEQYPIDKWEDIENGGKDNQNTTENLASWTRFFKEYTLPQLDADKGIVFFGHSLSPVFILHLVDRFGIQLKGALFASPFLEALNVETTRPFDVVNRSFYKTDFNWVRLRKLIPVSYVLYGENDPYVPIHLPIAFAKHLNSNLVPVKDGKHLGGELTEFPLLLELFKKISK